MWRVFLYRGADQNVSRKGTGNQSIEVDSPGLGKEFRIIDGLMLNDRRFMSRAEGRIFEGFWKDDGDDDFEFDYYLKWQTVGPNGFEETTYTAQGIGKHK